jgi:hypothetical protein
VAVWIVVFGLRQPKRIQLPPHRVVLFEQPRPFRLAQVRIGLGDGALWRRRTVIPRPRSRPIVHRARKDCSVFSGSNSVYEMAARWAATRTAP